MYDQKDRLHSKKIHGIKKCRNRAMRSAIIKKGSQDEQQRQTTTTLITSKTLCPFKKQHKNKVKIAFGKTKTKQKTFTSVEKMRDQSLTSP